MTWVMTFLCLFGALYYSIKGDVQTATYYVTFAVFFRTFDNKKAR